mmetsp:Transcript_34061/g.54297  ORF Transcript_34061/g.54297 Transcript_34061/m.54297 type:complete len:347 (-) Transcript_34061:195-1235(-)
MSVSLPSVIVGFFIVVCHGNTSDALDGTPRLPGNALDHLLDLAKPGDDTTPYKMGSLRLRAFDLLQATTNLPDARSNAEGQREYAEYLKSGSFDKLPKPVNLGVENADNGNSDTRHRGGKDAFEDKLETQSQEWVEQSENVYEHAQNLRDEATKALALVVEAADMFSALAKGLHITKENLQADKGAMNSIFEDQAKWEKYLANLERKGYLDKDGVARFTRRPINATDSEAALHRKQLVSEYLQEVVAVNGKMSKNELQMMNDFNIPEWYEVELDWLKEYAKLFNSDGRNGPSPNGRHGRTNSHGRETQSLHAAQDAATGRNVNNAITQKAVASNAKGKNGIGAMPP